MCFFSPISSSSWLCSCVFIRFNKFGCYSSYLRNNDAFALAWYANSETRYQRQNQQNLHRFLLSLSLSLAIYFPDSFDSINSTQCLTGCNEMKITDLRRNALVIHVNCTLYFPIGVQLNINKITENFEKFIWIVRAMCTFFLSAWPRDFISPERYFILLNEKLTTRSKWQRFRFLRYYKCDRIKNELQLAFNFNESNWAIVWRKKIKISLQCK